MDVLPNPGDRPELLALLHKDGQLTIVDMDAKTVSPRFGSNLTAACWSVRGKQIVCGDSIGNLTQFTPEGEAKTVTQAPTSLKGRSTAAVDIRWVENAVFVVTYVDTANPFDTSIFICNRAKDGSVTYNAILDPLMVENSDRQEARFNAWLKGWAPFKHLVLVANTTSNTISHIGQAPIEESGNDIVWSQVKNDLYTTLPLETSTVGLDLDLTDIEAPDAQENAGTTPTPMLWAYASDGSLSAWRICNSQGGQYSAIAAANDIIVNEEAGTVPTASNATAAPTTATAAAVASPFGNSGSAAFGQSSFGAAKSFSSPASPFGGGSAFGKSTFAPAFGQTTFGSSSPSPAFRQTQSFDQPAATTSGTSGGGFAAFGNKGSAFGAATSGNSSPFGSAAPTPPATSGIGGSPALAFVSSTAFGEAAKPVGSGTSSPFSMSASTSPAEEKKPAFGSSSPFGNASGTASPFSTSATSKPSGFPAFGDSSKSSAFGSFGAKTDGSKSAFAFGSPSSNTTNTFGQNATSSSFGALRDGTFGQTSEPKIQKKPTGLDDSEADNLEPQTVSKQNGGALDFEDGKSDKSEEASPLKLASLGFGTSANANKPASSSFGAFGKALDGVKKQDNADEASDKPTTASPFASAPGFGAFGMPSSHASSSAAKAASEGKPGFSFANAAQTVEGGERAEEKKPAFSFASTSKVEVKKPAFGAADDSKPVGNMSKPSTAFGDSSFEDSTKTNDKSQDASKPRGFAGFGQASPLGQPTGKTAFSFGKPAETPKGGLGFAAFASAGSGTSSPFGSPTSSAGKTSPFGQPGFFSSFGQKPAKPEESQAAFVNTKAEKEAEKPAKSAFPKTEIQQPVASTSKSTESEVADEGGEEEDYPDEYEEEQDDEDDYEHVDGEDAQEEVEDDEIEEDDDDSVQDEDETPTKRKEKDSDSAQEPDLASQTSSEPPSPTPAPPPVSNEPRTQTQPATEAPTKKSAERPPTFSFAPTKEGTTGDAAVKEPATKSPFGIASSESGKTPPFSFPALSAADTNKSKEAAVPTPAVSTPASFGSNASPSMTSPFATFGKPHEAKQAKELQEQPAKPTPPAFSFPSAPSSKPAAEQPKPFGFSNLQKAAPRTSSPLASMPAFAPNDSSHASQTSFELSNVSSVGDADPSPSNPSPFSLTPQSKPSSSPAFFQSAQTPKAGPPKAQEQSTPARPKLVSKESDPSLAALNTVPPKLSSALSQDRIQQQPGGDTVRVFVTMQEQLAAVRLSSLSRRSMY